MFKRFKRTVDMIDRSRRSRTRHHLLLMIQPPRLTTAKIATTYGFTRISEELRLLLSRKVILVKETERPPNANGG